MNPSPLPLSLYHHYFDSPLRYCHCIVAVLRQGREYRWKAEAIPTAAGGKVMIQTVCAYTLAELILCNPIIRFICDLDNFYLRQDE